MNLRLFLIVSTSILLAWTIQAQSDSTSGADAKRGSSLYADVCARCHGTDGKGEEYTKFKTPVADLTSPAVQLRMDAQLFQAIHDGKSNTAMGAWKYALSDEEIRDVLSFVRTLGTAQK